MATQDLARKYRPKCLADVVGQPVVVQTLTNAFKNNRLHQAYLLCGNFGTGKTTIGRILAAMENCEVSPGLNPCGQCHLCKAIFEGTHTDVEELDAAGNFGKVDQVRKLKEAAMYNPVDGAKKKYFIIDEFHNCSAAALDSLLKLLEEPPSHVRFVFCTTEINKITPTIVSRCQRHDFRKIYWSQISEQLDKIIRIEKIDCETGVTALCAKLADGSMRSAIQNLEKVVSFSGDDKVSLDNAQKLFGAVSEMLYYDLFDQIIGTNNPKPDAGAGFKIINAMLASGTSFDMLYDGIVEHLRNLMVCSTTASAWDMLVLSDEGKRRIKTQLKKIQEGKKLDAILQSITKLNKTKQAVEYNISPEITLQQWFLESIFAFRQDAATKT